MNITITPPKYFATLAAVLRVALERNPQEPALITADEREKLDAFAAEEKTRFLDMYEHYSPANVEVRYRATKDEAENNPTPETVAALAAFTGGENNRHVALRKVLSDAAGIRRNIMVGREKFCRENVAPIGAALAKRTRALVRQEREILEVEDRARCERYGVPYDGKSDVLRAVEQCEQSASGWMYPYQIYAVLGADTRMNPPDASNQPAATAADRVEAPLIRPRGRQRLSVPANRADQL